MAQSETGPARDGAERQPEVTLPLDPTQPIERRHIEAAITRLEELGHPLCSAWMVGVCGVPWKDISEELLRTYMEQPEVPVEQPEKSRNDYLVQWLANVAREQHTLLSNIHRLLDHGHSDQACIVAAHATSLFDEAPMHYSLERWEVERRCADTVAGMAKTLHSDGQVDQQVVEEAVAAVTELLDVLRAYLAQDAPAGPVGGMCPTCKEPWPPEHDTCRGCGKLLPHVPGARFIRLCATCNSRYAQREASQRWARTSPGTAY